MAGKSKSTSDMQDMWASNLAPYMMGMRRGAAHGMRIASRERARARMRSRVFRQRRRWMLMGASIGLAVMVLAGGISAIRARRQDMAQYAGKGEFAPSAEAAANRMGGAGRSSAPDMPPSSSPGARRGKPE